MVVYHDRICKKAPKKQIQVYMWKGRVSTPYIVDKLIPPLINRESGNPYNGVYQPLLLGWCPIDQ